MAKIVYYVWGSMTTLFKRNAEFAIYVTSVDSHMIKNNVLWIANASASAKYFGIRHNMNFKRFVMYEDLLCILPDTFILYYRLV